MTFVRALWFSYFPPFLLIMEVRPTRDVLQFAEFLRACSFTVMNGQSSKEERREATETEIKELRHVVDSIPLVVWIALVASAAERFTFYAVSTPWRKWDTFSMFRLITNRKLTLHRELHPERS